MSTNPQRAGKRGRQDRTRSEELRARTSGRTLHLEQLEDRAVPAYTVDLTGTVLTIAGGAGDASVLDYTRLASGGGTHQFNDPGLTFNIVNDDSGNMIGSGSGTITAREADVTEIILNLGDGADSVTFNNSVTDRITVNGEAGSDTFIFANGATLGVALSLINGGSGTDTLDYSAYTTARTANFTGAGGVDGVVGTEASIAAGFTNIDSVRGGTAGDSFVFADGVSGVSVDGQGGNDTLDLSAYTTARSLTLTGLGGTDGFAGTEAGGAPTSFDDINTITGGTGSDTLTGRNAIASWGVDGTPQYTSGNTLDFSAIENMTGGTAADTFNITGAQTANLNGGDGADSFVFADAATLTGSIDGGSNTNDFLDFSAYTTSRAFNLTANGGTDGATGTEAAISATFTNIDRIAGGTAGDTFTFANAVQITFLDGQGGNDTLDLSAYATARNITLTGLGTTDGFAGGESGNAPNQFDDINTIVGGAGTDTLTGRNAISTWGVDGTNQYTSGARTLDFSAIENLAGGSAADTFNVTASTTANLIGGDDADSFVFSDAVVLTGSIDGGANTGDTLDLSAYTTARAFNFTANGGTDGVTGTEAAVSAGYTNIDRVAGGSAGDSFTFANGVQLTFIDGQGGADTIDLSAYATARSITLTGLGTTDGFAGGEAGNAPNQFDDINSVTGGAGTDTLTGRNATASWGIDGTNDYTSGARVLLFSAFENLTGGTADDTFNVTASTAANLNGGAGTDAFVFSDAVVLTGTIDGGANTDTLNYAAYSTSRSVTLTGTGASDGFNGTESSVSGGFSNIDSLTGGAAADTLTGQNASAVWGIDGTNQYTSGGRTLDFSAVENLTGGSSDDVFNITGAQTANLNGSGGADSFVFADGATLTGSIDGGANTSDLLNMAAYPTARSFNFTANGGTDGVTGTEAAISATYTNIDRVSGGSAGDTFAFADGVQITFIDGQGGNDTLNLSAYTSARSVTLTGLGATDGFAGGEAGNAPNQFDDINTITGGAGTDTLSGRNATAVWGIDGTNQYTSGGRTLDFSALENLNGGTSDDMFDVSGAQTANLNGGGGPDLFNFADGATLTGSIDGGADTGDELNFSLYSTARSFNFTANGGTDGATGTEAAISAGYTNINRVIGSTAADSFTFADGVQITFLDGQVGNDTLSLAAYTTARAVTLAGAGSTDGFAGGEAGNAPTVFDNINILTGGAGSDTLTGLSAVSTWDIDGTNQYTSGARTLDFSSMENLIGGTAADTFNISGAQAVNLTGGDGADSFNFADAATLTGAIDGQAGTDTLNYSAYTSARSVFLTTTGGTDGWNGTEAAITGGFANIDSLTGGAASDTLTGQNATAVWGIDGTNQYTSGGRTLSFSAVENLTGGTADDTFNITGAQTANLIGGAGPDTFSFADGATLTGSIDGGADTTDLLDFSAYNSSRAVTFTANGATDGANGTEAAVSAGFTNINRVSGGSAADSFTFADGVQITVIDGQAGSDTINLSAYTTARNIVLTGLGTTDGFAGGETGSAPNQFDDINVIVGGGAAADTLTGLNAVNTWGIDGTNQYTSGARTLDFSALEGLTGGTAADTFNVSGAQSVTLNGAAGDDIITFADGSSITGSINGGANNDTIDFSAYTTARNVVLNGVGSTDGFTGTEAAIGAGFDNIDSIAGGTAADSLTGANLVNGWNITAANGGTLTSGANSLAFSSFQNLNGGTAEDTFTLATAGVSTVAGTINGGTGTDTLVAPNATNTWNITATDTGTINDGTVTTSFTSIGGLTGNAGADSFAFADGVGVTGVVNGAGGNDTLDYSAYGAGNPVTIDLMTGTATNTGGVAGFETLLGGAGNDSFTVQSSPTIAFNVNGNGGSNLLFFDANGQEINIVGNTVTAGTDQPVTFNNVSLVPVNVAGNVNVVGTAGNDTLILRRTSATTHEYVLNGGVAVPLAAAVTTFNFSGLGGADVFRIEETAFGLPSFSGAVATGHTNAAFAASGLTPGNVSIHFESTGASRLELALATANNVAYFSDNVPGQPNSGVVNVAGVFSMSFDGLAPITMTGVGGTLTVDATSTPATSTLTVSDDGTAGDGVMQIVGDGGFETVTFSGFTGLVVRGGDGAETINLASVDSATSLASIALSGDNTTSTDASAEAFNVSVLPAGITVTVDGGAGSDLLVGPNATVAWSILFANSGTMNGINSFSNIEALTGGTGADTFTFANTGSIAGLLDGGAGNDTIVGDDDGNAFVINAANAGTLAGKSSGFTSIENLTGGTGDDTFTIFNDGVTTSGSLSGNLDGGPHATADTLDYSNYTIGAINVNLPAGTATAIGGTMTRIENIVGSPAGGTFQIADGVSNTLTLPAGDNTVTALDGAVDTIIVQAGLTIFVSLDGIDIVTILPGGSSLNVGGFQAATGKEGLDVFRDPDFGLDTQNPSATPHDTTGLTIAELITGIQNYIDRLFTELLGRLPTAQERLDRLKWVVEQNATSYHLVRELLLRPDRFLGGTKAEDIRPDTMATDRFFTESGSTNAGLVTAVHQAVFGVAPSAAAVALYSSQLDAGADRASVINQVVVDGYLRQLFDAPTDSAAIPARLATTPDRIGAVTQSIRDRGLQRLRLRGSTIEVVEDILSSVTFFEFARNPATVTW